MLDGCAIERVESEAASSSGVESMWKSSPQVVRTRAVPHASIAPSACAKLVREGLDRQSRLATGVTETLAVDILINYRKGSRDNRLTIYIGFQFRTVSGAVPFGLSCHDSRLKRLHHPSTEIKLSI